MVLQRGQSLCMVLILTESVFIDNTVITGIVEEGWRNPGLEDIIFNFIVESKSSERSTSSTSQPPRFTPRTFCDPYGKPEVRA